MHIKIWIGIFRPMLTSLLLLKNDRAHAVFLVAWLQIKKVTNEFFDLHLQNFLPVSEINLHLNFILQQNLKLSSNSGFFISLYFVVQPPHLNC